MKEGVRSDVFRGEGGSEEGGMHGGSEEDCGNRRGEGVRKEGEGGTEEVGREWEGR